MRSTKISKMRVPRDQMDYTQHPYQLTPVMLEAFEEAKRKKYLIGRWHALVQAWQHYCKTYRLPCIIIHLRGKYTTLTVDIVLCDFVLSEKHLDLIIEAICENSRPEADITVGLDFCKSSNVYTERADSLAVKMLEIIEQARVENKACVTVQERNNIGQASPYVSRVIGNTHPTRASYV